MILYGISNCDTVKKAKNWLETNQLEYSFHDFRKQGLEPDIIQGWLTQIAWDKLLNKRSTTWRNLEPEVQQSVNAENIIHLLVENPTLIKRPVLKVNGIINVGFNIDTYKGLFKQVITRKLNTRIVYMQEVLTFFLNCMVIAVVVVFTIVLLALIFGHLLPWIFDEKNESHVDKIT